MARSVLVVQVRDKTKPRACSSNRPTVAETTAKGSWRYSKAWGAAVSRVWCTNPRSGSSACGGTPQAATSPTSARATSIKAHAASSPVARRARSNARASAGRGSVPPRVHTSSRSSTFSKRTTPLQRPTRSCARASESVHTGARATCLLLLQPDDVVAQIAGQQRVQPPLEHACGQQEGRERARARIMRGDKPDRPGEGRWEMTE